MSTPAFTLSTGPRACGKTTLLKLLAQLANNGCVIVADTSEIIDLHISKGTKLGQQLATYRAEKVAGKVLPCDKIVFEAVIQWVMAKQERQNVHHVLLGGSPRSEKQSRLWMGYTRQISVINIHAEPHEVKDGVIRRQQITGVARPDETEEAIQNAINDYKNRILPGLEVFNGHVLRLKRSQPMRERLKLAINHGKWPDQVRRRMLVRLDTPTHPVSIMVDEMDGVVRR
jgi:adenylate kinase family enzyme